ncbi:MAG: class C sortase [Lachnospiraceae bacterium]|nr:class C sortase [Lachnospiraceae bacterium]
MKKIKTIGSIIIILSGLVIAMYPFYSNILYSRNATKVINEYRDEIVDMEQEEIDAIKEAAAAYNDQLKAVVIQDATGDWKTEGTSYLDMLGIGSALGYITIPKIDVNLPIYHGSSEVVLEKGVGHIEQSSFPLGGESTHSVLTGHRGMPNAVLFTDLDKVEKGDKFYLHILDEVLAYQVDQIKVVEPTDTSDLRIIEGKDYCSLVTCTPYAINSHRLILRGTRVPYTGEEEITDDNYQGFSTGMVVKRFIDVWPLLLVAAVVVMGLEVFIMILLIKRSVKREQRRNKK